MGEQDLVELVAADGSPIGSSTVVDAHTGDGLLHRAFSVVLIDHNGQTLLQRRAASKTRFPLAWANSCCGHPGPGEPTADAAKRRLAEELGVRDVELSEVGVYAYTAGDPVTGRVEREYDHVLIGWVDSELTLAPDPDEVESTRWVAWTEALTTSDGYAPWLPGVLDVVHRSGLAPDIDN
jgi:isopentenyl-diphosphate delta-isomerase